MSMLKSFFSAINMCENWNAQYNGCTGVYYIDTHIAYIIPLSIPPWATGGMVGQKRDFLPTFKHLQHILLVPLACLKIGMPDNIDMPVCIIYIHTY